LRHNCIKKQNSDYKFKLGGFYLKNIFFINGTMGVGKTTTSRELQRLLPKCVFLDGDWCWDMNPFIVTDETKKWLKIIYVMFLIIF
jgi:predicted AAA+ superfamily ATPase